MDLVEIVGLGRGLRRYVIASFRTLRLLLARRPDVLIVQNPSLLLGLLAVTVGRRWANTVVTDTHNAGLFPLEGRSRLLTWLAAYVASQASRVIVTNEALARHVAGLGGVPVVLPDPLPSWTAPAVGSADSRDMFTIVVVCGWGRDEPIESIREACRQLEQRRGDLRVLITGKARGELLRDPWPSVAQLTGFLAEDEYQATLTRADVVVVLTTREDCLTCGAYEALALEKPMVLSATEAIRQYFTQGVVYTTLEPDKIASAVTDALENRERLTREAGNLRRQKELLTRALVQDLRGDLFSPT